MTNRQPFEKAYKMEEAAAQLRICRRKLQDLIARHPHYHANGNRKLFTETDLSALRSAMGWEARGCPPAPKPVDRSYNDGATVGLIYFLQGSVSRRIKIGFTTNLDRRLKALMTGCPERVTVLGTLIGTLAEEKALHRRFAAYREQGEWFLPKRCILAVISSARKL